MTERRKTILTETDLDNIEERWKKSACNRGLSDADAVFLRNLRTSTEITMGLVWKGFLRLMLIGVMLLAAAGFLTLGYKLIKGLPL